MTNPTCASTIELAWLTRAAAQDLKPKSMAYKRAEVEFFAGAMAALNAAFPPPDPASLSASIPPIWIINILSGRPVVPRDL